MAKKNGKAPESAQEAVLAQEASQDIQEAKTAPEAPANAAEDAGLVLYQVSAPRGIYLRVGPGRAYHPLGVLENGTEVMGTDLAGMLRAGRKSGETAWIKVTSKAVGPSLPAEPATTDPTAQALSGWVDSEFLERCF